MKDQEAKHKRTTAQVDAAVVKAIAELFDALDDANLNRRLWKREKQMRTIARKHLDDLRAERARLLKAGEICNERRSAWPIHRKGP